MRYILTVFVAIVASAVFGQTNCSTAGPYIDNGFVFYNPSQITIQRCYTFTSPSDSIDFTFTLATTPPGTCLDQPLYQLYDQNCGTIDTANGDGLFINLTPNTNYVLCYSVTCSTGQVAVLFTSEEIVLPIELLYFTAQSTPNGIDLLWASGSELNCAGFFLERSIDASNWLNIGYVEGAGNSQIVTRYLFEDAKPTPGVNYYRLTQYDLNGDFEILQTIAIVWNEEVITNPFRHFNFLGQKVAR